MAIDIFDVSAKGLRKEVARHMFDGKARADVPPMGEPDGRHWIIDQGMGCLDPYRVEHHAKALNVVRLTRCRKCRVCRDHHRRYWSARALAEYAASESTWLGTLTLSPANHSLLDARVEKTWYARGVDIREMTPQELFSARVRELGSDVTKWLKRLRHHMPGGAGLRYMLVAEAHNGKRTSPEMRGRPHLHILLNEQKAGTLIPVTEYYPSGNRIFTSDDAWIRKHWDVGFTKFELMTHWRGVWYVTKYMHKERFTRVRASLRYGEGFPHLLAPEGHRVPLLGAPVPV